MVTHRDVFPVLRTFIDKIDVPLRAGTPLYDAWHGMNGLADPVRADRRILLDAGVDCSVFCNEDDRPYVFEAGHGPQ